MKGQVATEYLILLSIVLIVSLVALGTIGDVPKLTRGFGTAAFSEFWNNAEIAIQAHTFYANGTVVMIVKNNKAYPIHINSIEIDGQACPTDVTLYPGRSETVFLHCSGSGSPGGRYSKKVSFRYEDVENIDRGEFVYAPEIKLTGINEE